MLIWEGLWVFLPVVLAEGNSQAPSPAPGIWGPLSAKQTLTILSRWRVLQGSLVGGSLPTSPVPLRGQAPHVPVFSVG